MLDRMTPEQFTERWAADRLDVETWEIGAMIAAQVANAAATQILAKAGRSPQPRDLLDARDLVPRPGWMRRRDKNSQYLSDEQAEAELRKML